MSEIEFAGVLEFEAKKRGHEGLIRMRGLNIEGYAWQVLSGPSGSLVSEADTPAGGQGLSPAFPMGPGFRRIQSNEPVFVDFPICYNGYLADQARMYCLGEMPEKFVKAYQFQFPAHFVFQIHCQRQYVLTSIQLTEACLFATNAPNPRIIEETDKLQTGDKNIRFPLPVNLPYTAAPQPTTKPADTAITAGFAKRFSFSRLIISAATTSGHKPSWAP